MNFHKDLSFEKFGSLLLDNSQSSEEYIYVSDYLMNHTIL